MGLGRIAQAGVVILACAVTGGCAPSGDSLPTPAPVTSTSAPVTSTSVVVVPATALVTGLNTGAQRPSPTRGPVSGTLVSVDGCVVLQRPDGSQVLAVFPRGYVLSDGGLAVDSGRGKAWLGRPLVSSTGRVLQRGDIGEEAMALVEGLDVCGHLSQPLFVFESVEGLWRLT